MCHDLFRTDLLSIRPMTWVNGNVPTAKMWIVSVACFNYIKPYVDQQDTASKKALQKQAGPQWKVYWKQGNEAAV